MRVVELCGFARPKLCVNSLRVDPDARILKPYEAPANVMGVVKRDMCWIAAWSDTREAETVESERTD